jgi:hypothetical protein
MPPLDLDFLGELTLLERFSLVSNPKKHPQYGWIRYSPIYFEKLENLRSVDMVYLPLTRRDLRRGGGAELYKYPAPFASIETRTPPMVRGPVSLYSFCKHKKLERLHFTTDREVDLRELLLCKDTMRELIISCTFVEYIETLTELKHPNQVYMNISVLTPITLSEGFKQKIKIYKEEDEVFKNYVFFSLLPGEGTHQ